MVDPHICFLPAPVLGARRLDVEAAAADADSVLPDLTADERERVRAVVPGFRPVGYVRSGYGDPAGTPIQARRNDAATGRLEVFPEFAGGLDGLAGFDYAWVITWLDRALPVPEGGRVVPFMLSHTGEDVGVFATRHPSRPNPLGLSVVNVVEVDGSGLTFRGVDVCHGTPVLDIKPWQQNLDVPEYAQGWERVRRIRGGWYESTGVADAAQMFPRP
jgi:tRNA-Thr(GGU) m(6)t(6)A37 methyltransferase TsaA